jgi:electron transfer flavoprotein alpha subunit
VKAALALFGGEEAGRAAYSSYRILKRFADAGYACELWLFCEELPAIVLFDADAVIYAKETSATLSFTEYLFPRLEMLYSQRLPDVLLLAEDWIGAELCPKLACRKNAACLTACADVHLADGRIYAEKSVYSGNVFADFVVESFPLCLTLKTDSGEQWIPDAPYGGEILLFEGEREGETSKREGTYTVELTKTTPFDKANLADARVVFAVGRGFGDRLDVKQLYDMAEKLGISLGATRPMIQTGMMPLNSLIGSTGVSVFPKLLITAGVSGSGPFMAGARYAEKIIAVNTDPNAPIFLQSDMGILADCGELLREMANIAHQAVHHFIPRRDKIP